MPNSIHPLINTLSTMLDEFLAHEHIRAGEIFVLGCSTSEVAGGVIGKQITPELGTVIVDTIYKKVTGRGLYLAVQCCEHLNRALAVEKSTAEKFGYDTVSAVPKYNAGGSAAAAAFALFERPVLVESVRAGAGIDIGDTFIGMHLKPVAIPVRVSSDTLGAAHVTLAVTRPKYIGGPRAVYE